MFSVADKLYVLERLLYRLEHVLKPSIGRAPLGLREEARLPAEGATVSVETALNSRCSSDYDGNRRRFHWGVFDRARTLSQEQVAEAVALAQIPRFTGGRIAIDCDGNMLTFWMDNHAKGVEREWLMVESGMQQQSVGLVCSALGIGMVMRNLGQEGLAISEGAHATTRALLDAMKPTYDGSFWSDKAPAGRVPWLRGNLPDPVRDGDNSLVVALSGLGTKNEGTKQPTLNSLSQLLWAARGRTPHLYKTRPWGLTIPTWGGEQNLSSVYVISDSKLSQYANWSWNRPTHSLLELGEVEKRSLHLLRQSGLLDKECIVIGRNEQHSRSLWEVGYQLLNLLVQAKVLDISCEAALLDENHKTILGSIGISDPTAVVTLKPA